MNTLQLMPMIWMRTSVTTALLEHTLQPIVFIQPGVHGMSTVICA